jgi:hypothetical protein
MGSFDANYIILKISKKTQKIHDFFVENDQNPNPCKLKI